MRIAVLALLAVGLPGVAHAATYTSLVGDGYETSKMVESPGGSRGWYLAKGDDRYFCKMNVSMVQGGPTGIASFTSSGRMLPLDKATVEGMGATLSDFPRLSDLEAGKPPVDAVGGCSRAP